MKSLVGRTMTAALWSSLEISARYSIQLLVTIALAHLLSPKDFGLIAMVLVFTAFGTLFVDSGLSTALIQRQRTTPDDETTVFVFNVIIASLGAVLLYVAAPFIASFYAQPALESLARFMVLIFPLAALAAVPDALLIQRMEFKTRTQVEVGTSVISGVCGVGLAWFGFGIWALAWQSVISIGGRAILLWILAGWRPVGHFRPAALRQLIGFGGFMLTVNMLETLYTRLQILLIGKLFSSRDTGFYTIAQNTQQVPTSLAGAVLNRVGLPLFSSLNEVALLEALRRSLAISMFIFVPAMATLAVFAKPLVRLVYGPEWAPVGALLSVLVLGAAVWPWQVLNLAAISSQGRADALLRVALINKTIAIALLLIATRWGLLAIAWSTVASSVLSSVVDAGYVRKLLHCSAAQQTKQVLATFALTAFACAVGWGAFAFLAGGVAAMLIALAAAIAAYVGLAVAFRHPATTEIRTLCAMRGLR
jgi:O-antigen/teichoic acid export membrane protein